MSELTFGVLTKIIATLGPASSDVDSIIKLIHEGARVFRINFSHGRFEDFERLLKTIRQASERAACSVGVLGDLSGPKIRLARLKRTDLVLSVGDQVEFVAAVEHMDEDGSPLRLASTYAHLLEDVLPGHRLLIDDGAVRLLAVDAYGHGDQRRLRCQVIQGGPISSSKGLNLPDSQLDRVSSITDWDWQCAAWAIEHELDYLALSFVRRADDLEQLRRFAVERGRDGAMRLPLIAKIEKPQALDDLDGILKACDVVMVARGDLGVEMDLAEVPVIQKRIIARAHDLGRPAIVATQMLQSMIEHAHPTRAEVSDVANAIFDGADVVMLSGETAVGRYGPQAVRMMAHIARTTQAHLAGPMSQSWTKRPFIEEGRYRTAALARGVATIVSDLDPRLVVIWSQSGKGALYFSKNRLHVPIVAATSDLMVLRRMNILFGVQPVLMDQPRDVAEFLRNLDILLVERGWAALKDPVLTITGEPIGTPGVSNAIRVHYVGDEIH
ncbi:MAG: pyruvate kinase [Phycisphaeraceae bacterium]|nr:pyruvate kinase [Phycisphaeraceae bacterium]